MLKMMKRAVVVAAVAAGLALAGASNASAVNVGVLGTPVGSGSMTIDATAGSSRLVVNGSVALNCTDTRANGSINTGSYVTTFPITIGTVQPLFSNVGGGDCIGPSGFEFGVTCVNTSSLQATAAPTGGTTASQIVGISCVVSFTPLGCSATVSGSVKGSYTNPTAGSPATPGRLVVFIAGQALTVSGSTCPPAVLPNGTGQYGAPVGSGTGLANLSYTLTGANTTHPVLS